MITSLLYILVTLGLIAGVVWMVGHTLSILLAEDSAESSPSRRFDDPVAG